MLGHGAACVIAKEHGKIGKQRIKNLEKENLLLRLSVTAGIDIIDDLCSSPKVNLSDRQRKIFKDMVTVENGLLEEIEAGPGAKWPPDKFRPRYS